MSSLALPRRRQDDEFTGERHVYEPHRVGLPPLHVYLREVWRRRQFAYELSRTTLRSQHYQTVLGVLWLVLNPLLLGLVYFLLVDILRSGQKGGAFFAHLLGAIFAYHFFSQSMQQGVKSVVGGGKLILNTAFPRVLLPIAAVITGFMRFLPTMIVYAIVHVASGRPVGPELLWTIPVFGLLAVFTTGTVMLVAAAQVYFRDVRNFLPYMLRIWMYATPVLYTIHEIPAGFRALLYVNPLTPIIGAWSEALTRGVRPRLEYFELGAAWAVVALVVGSLFFVSREREFAVRL
jgi:ABC-type polysaccharide/polyol phosphate export permease